jgi:hypothetical protein
MALNAPAERSLRYERRQLKFLDGCQFAICHIQPKFMLPTLNLYKMPQQLSRLFAGVLLMSFFCGCQKQRTNIPPTSSLVEVAQAYFNNAIATGSKSANRKNYRANLPRSLDWLSAVAEGGAVVVPVQYGKGLYASISTHPEFAYSLSDITSLVVWHDSTRQFHAAVMTYLPDSAYSTTGTWLLEDWQGNSLATPFHLGSTAAATTTQQAASLVEPEVVQSIQVCNEIDGYNYSPDDPNGGVAWSESSCNTYSISQQTSGPGIPPIGLPRPTSLRIAPAEIIIAPPSTPITNIADYFKCFTDGSSPDHTYSVEVCVDQPEPGTRDPWGLTPGGLQGSSEAGNMVNSGHTFLVLSENDQGNITTRNVGFYPSSSVIPTTTGSYSQGILNNDQAHTYNISLTINVSSTEFFNILNYTELGNNQGYYYNLFSNNCTTFALNALQAGGINLPDTQGTWPGGSGNDPGDLGQDIAAMNLTPNMTRNTTGTDHPNIGTCN